MEAKLRKLREVLKNGEVLQPLFDNITEVLNEYERALAGRRMIKCSGPGFMLIQHTSPSQRELDATSEALGTTELLEQILLGLLSDDLRQAQLVCKHFDSTIRGSPAIRITPAMKTGGPNLPRLLTIRHLGLEHGGPPHWGWHFFAKSRKGEASSVLQYAAFCKMQISVPPAEAFRMMETCSIDGGPISRSKPTIVVVRAGVTFGHVFAALVELFGAGKQMRWRCGNTQCEDNNEGSDGEHAVLIDITCRYNSAALDKEQAKPRLYDIGDVADPKSWRKQLVFANMQTMAMERRGALGMPVR